MLGAELVSEKLAFFEQAKKSIKTNGNLSEKGRERALNNLQGSINAYQETAISLLRGNWKTVRRRYQELDSEMVQAEQNASDRFNYDKLNYEKGSARERIQNARTIEEVIQDWEQSRGSFLERQKAWAEQYDTLRLRFPGDFRANGVAVQMEQLNEQLSETDEIQEVKKRQGELVNDAWKLHQSTQTAKNFYYPGVFQLTDEFSEMLKGVNIRQSVDAETLAIRTHLAFSEPVPNVVVVA